MDIDNNKCQKCCATMICNRDIAYNSTHCIDFGNDLKNYSDKKILEFAANHYKGRGAIKDDLFIQSLIKLKEERDDRMKDQLQDMLGPFLKN